VKFESIITVSFISVLGLENLGQILLERLKIHLHPKGFRKNITLLFFSFIRIEWSIIYLHSIGPS
jgi:hypothetical protein